MSKKKPLSPEAEKRAETMTIHREKRLELWHRLTAVNAPREQYVQVMRAYTDSPAAAEALVSKIEQQYEQ